MMTIDEKIEALEGAIELMDEGLGLIKDLADENPNFDAYVYRAISEHIRNSNPYNQSLLSTLVALEADDRDYG